MTRRKPLAARFDDPTLTAIAELAADETEGNDSHMLRRLVREALEARGVALKAQRPVRRPEPSPAPTTPDRTPQRVTVPLSGPRDDPLDDIA